MAQPTLGIEEELHLIDPKTSQLAARASQLLARLPSESFSAELQRTTVETNTRVCASLTELRADLVRLRSQLSSVAEEHGLALAAVGTAPMSNVTDFEITASGRFGRMHEEYRLLVDEQLICGTQVHVGIDNRDLAVQVMQRISRDLPLLLALSASSPFWRGKDTGYSSIRTIIWQRWPSAGSTGRLESAQEYDALLADLINSGVIADAKMAYFDVRPSAHVPTIELRVCDSMPMIDDAVAIAGLFRASVLAAQQDIAGARPWQPVAPPLHRAAMWRAARSGLRDELLDTSDHPQPVPAAAAVRSLLARLRPQLEELGDWDDVSDLTEAILTRGNSADRQRAAYAETGRLEDAVSLVLDETRRSGAVAFTRPRTGLLRYPARAGDEAFQPDGRPRPSYSDVMGWVEKTSPPEVTDVSVRRDEWALAHGMTFGVSGEQRPFPVDLLPRIIAAHEWQALSAGLVQRARAIELFLRDVYGDQRVITEGIVSAETVMTCPGWRPEGVDVPAGAVRAPVMGFDLVRDWLGGWRVLEDNVRVPSGAGYAMAIRDLMDDVVPDLPRPGDLEPLDAGPRLLHQTLAACARGIDEPTLGLLSDGAGNSAWFEHRLLAERAGLLLLQPSDVDVVDGHAVVRSTGAPLHVLYLRLNVELVDLVDDSGRAVGADIMRAVQAGTVSVANTPGNGVADDKAMYCYLPDLINYYLGERPLLDSVPTYRCSDPDERGSVLERVGELVTKPIDGYGGGGVLVGPFASAAEVSARRGEIVAEPSRWVAQEMVSLSSHPTFDDGELQPRHIDLRAFVYCTGTEAEDITVAPFALTRVAPAGSMVVNSSRGGGAKDTWIIGASRVDADRSL